MDDGWIDVGIGFETKLSTGASGEPIFSIGDGGSFGGDYEGHRFQVAMHVAL